MIQDEPRRWWAFGALMLGMLTIAFDMTILNVALPTLATSVDATTSQLQWLIDAYVLVFASLMLPMGVLGDRYGRKRLIVAGLAMFAVSSVVAAATTSVGALIVVRAFMGLSAAILTPMVVAVIPVLFWPAERPKAIAYTMMAMGAGMPLGPIIGGYLLRHFWWGSIFLVNVPVAVVGLIAVVILLPESRDRAPQRPDLVGGALCVAGLVGFVYGVIEAPERGWGSRPVLTGLIVGLLLLAGFVGWERRTGTPMIDLRLFALPRFLWGTVAGTIVTFGLLGLLFVLPQYLQAVRGDDALDTGVRLLPLMAGLVVGTKLGEIVSARVGARIPVCLGLGVTAVGLALGALTTVGSGYGWVATWLSITGVGVGWALTPAMDAVVGELPPLRSGAGMSITMTLRQVAGALGVAVLGSLSSAAYTGRLTTAGRPAAVAAAARDSVNGAVAVARRLNDAALLVGARTAYVHAMVVVLLTCAAVMVVGAALTGMFLPARSAVAQGAEPAVAQGAEPAGTQHAGAVVSAHVVREQSSHGRSRQR